MTVGFFSPLPPAHTGVADYSATLLKAMHGSGHVLENRSGDVNLYHLGNNALHGEIYDRALAEPGVVVLHDAVLNHFFLGKFGNEVYVTEFVYNYGAWSESLARRLWAGRARSGADPLYFRYPMLRRIAERSLSVIVHNALAARLAAEQGAREVHRIPHLFEAPFMPPEHEVVRLRERIGVRPGELLLGIFGHLRETKRIPVVLRALARARAAYSGVKLLVCGDFASRDLPLSVGEAIHSEGVIRIGHLSEYDFLLHAAAADVCVNLRWPSAGETSGIAIRLMGMGKCVILTAGEETADFPDDAVLRVDAGPAEEEMLTAFLIWLAENPGKTRAIGARAAAHIHKFHSLEHVGGEYWRVLSGCYHEKHSSAVT